MACPHVSGVVALGLSYALKIDKKLDYDEFLAILYSSVNDLDYYIETCSKKAYGVDFNLAYHETCDTVSTILARPSPFCKFLCISFCINSPLVCSRNRGCSMVFEQRPYLVRAASELVVCRFKLHADFSFSCSSNLKDIQLVMTLRWKTILRR